MRELAGEQDLAGVDDAPELATIEGHSRTLAQQTILGVGGPFRPRHILGRRSPGK